MPTRIFLDEAPLRLQPDAPAGALHLPMSVHELMDAGLARFPPSEIAMENAIAHIEDGLMPLIPKLRESAHEVLQATGPLLRMIAQAAGYPPTQSTLRISTEELERVFNRVVDVAAGLPARSQGIPESAEFVAALLVIREILHHVGYAALEITDD